MRPRSERPAVDNHPVPTGGPSSTKIDRRPHDTEGTSTVSPTWPGAAPSPSPAAPTSSAAPGRGGAGTSGGPQTGSRTLTPRYPVPRASSLTRARRLQDRARGRGEWRGSARLAGTMGAGRDVTRRGRYRPGRLGQPRRAPTVAPPAHPPALGSRSISPGVPGRSHAAIPTGDPSRRLPSGARLDVRSATACSRRLRPPLPHAVGGARSGFAAHRSSPRSVSGNARRGGSAEGRARPTGSAPADRRATSRVAVPPAGPQAGWTQTCRPSHDCLKLISTGPEVVLVTGV